MGTAVLLIRVEQKRKTFSEILGQDWKWEEGIKTCVRVDVLCMLE